VLIRGPLPIAGFELGFGEGDIIASFNRRRISSLSQLQEAINQAPEDKPIIIGVRRGGLDLTFTLSALGPSVPGANHLPADVRERLKAAIEGNGLHPDHISSLTYRVTDPTPGPGQSARGSGTITKISDSSITIELFDTGKEWTLPINRSTLVTGYGAPNGLADLNVGEFVEIFTSGDAARNINSKSAPLRPP
jgi:hypothetical protein